MEKLTFNEMEAVKKAYDLLSEAWVNLYEATDNKTLKGDMFELRMAVNDLQCQIIKMKEGEKIKW